MAIQTVISNADGGTPLRVGAASSLLMEGALAPLRRLDEVVQLGGVLAIEAEMEADGLSHRIGAWLHSDNPYDRVTNLTNTALRYAVTEVAEDLRPLYVHGREDERALQQAYRSVTEPAQKSIQEVSKLRDVIVPVFEREFTRRPDIEEHALIAINSVGHVRRIAGRSLGISRARTTYFRLNPGKASTPYDSDKFTLVETETGLSLAYARPKEINEVVRKARTKLPRTRALNGSPVHAKCPALEVTDEKGNLVEAAWQFMTHILVANAQHSSAERLRRDMTLAGKWALSKMLAV